MLREHEGVLAARRWALATRRRDLSITVPFLVLLHKKMFSNIWNWAGQLRRSEHPDGARWPTIGIELNDLVGEVRFWRERKLHPPDELALRFHHRLLRVRAWEGGNGSHARLAADALVVYLRKPPFSWGADSTSSFADSRERYAAALRDADSGSFQLLREFARAT